MGAAEDQKSGGSGRKGIVSGASGQRILHEAVVVDVFSNPQALDNAGKAKLLTSGFAVSNTARVQSMPRNSISAIVISDGGGQKNKAQIFYPLLPPNISMPAKPGEQVWVIFPDGSGDNGYWLGRISSDYDVDDINYTHRDRESQREMILAGSGKVEGSSSMKSTDPPNFVNGKENAKAAARTLKQADDYETFYNNSTALPEFTPEAVPRYTKQAPALCLQGSNNTLIALTEEISDDGAFAYTNDAASTGKGAIDIVAGRGPSGATAAAEIANERGNQETDKRVVLANPATPNLTEGNPNFSDDLSRVYVTMNSAAGDGRFGSSGILALGTVDVTDKTGPFVVNKSTHTRIISRSDGSIKIVHEGGSNIVMDSSGNIQIQCAGVIEMGSTAGSTTTDEQPFVRGTDLKAAADAFATAMKAIILPTPGGPAPFSGIVDDAVDDFATGVTDALSAVIKGE